MLQDYDEFQALIDWYKKKAAAASTRAKQNAELLTAPLIETPEEGQLIMAI